MSLENDVIRIRQQLRYLQKYGIGGNAGDSVFITYHESDVLSVPSNPTGDGSTGGWSTTATNDANWMSTKLADVIANGTWSAPIRITGLDGVDGGTKYYIKPIDGTAIHNSTGELTIEARKLESGSDTILSAGDIKLYDPDDNAITVGNGYASGSDGYTGVLDSGDIDGSKIVVLKELGESVLDSIVLVDIADGADGDDSIHGSISADNGLAWVQAKHGGSWAPVGSTSTLTVNFYQGGASINTRTVIVTRTDANLAAPTINTVDGITYTRVGTGTQVITIEFTHVASGIKVSETLYTSQGGDEGDTGPAGADGSLYYIKPTAGTAIHNSSGELTIEARHLVGGVDVILSAGTIKLFDPSNNEVTVGNGYATGSDGYTGVLDSGDIDGSKIITLKDGSGGTPLDTITLVDIADGGDGNDGNDGADGDDAIHGSISADNGLAWVQAKHGGSWAPVDATSTLTVNFYQGGASINTRTVVVTRTDENLAAPSPDTVDGITYTRVGTGTQVITIEFEHVASGQKVSETLYTSQGGDEGDDGADGDLVPILFGVDFKSNDPTSTAVSWSAGKIVYGATEVTMTAGGNTTNKYIYWDGPTATVLASTASLATATTGADRWLVCINDSGTANPAMAQRLINAGMIEVTTLAAIVADIGSITAGEILLSGLDGSATTAALARYQLKINAGGVQGRWRGTGKPAWSDTESGSGTTYNSGWREIVDITGNEVKVSFDSFDSGDSVGLETANPIPKFIMHAEPYAYTALSWYTANSIKITAATGGKITGQYEFYSALVGQTTYWKVSVVKIASPNVYTVVAEDNDTGYLDEDPMEVGIDFDCDDGEVYFVEIMFKGSATYAYMRGSSQYAEPTTFAVKKT